MVSNKKAACLSGYSCFRRLNSSSIVSRGLSLMSSMFSHPMTYMHVSRHGCQMTIIKQTHKNLSARFENITFEFTRISRAS